MSPFDRELSRRLELIRQQGLRRELRRLDSPQSPHIQVGGQRLLNFSSNDYLGLANEPAIKDAAVKAVQDYGAGAGASRLICGSLAPHHELEESLAHFKGTEAALTFVSGYAAALGTITALVGKGDVVVIDRLAHACLVDAARQCGARLRVCRHNDPDHLESILRWADSRERVHRVGVNPDAVTNARPRVLIVTESVFSMDGDLAPLRALVELKDRYGAWLMVDEAHATGLYGPHRRGLAEEAGVGDRVEVQMGTLGKALGAAGGYICGSRPLIDYLVNRARSFIFSTAPVPAAAAAATASIRLVQSSSGTERVHLLWQRVSAVERGLAGYPKPAFGPAPLAPSRCPPRERAAIIPLHIGDETQAVAIANELQTRGIFIPAIRYPTVARGAARLRLTVTASHTAEDVAGCLAALREGVLSR